MTVFKHDPELRSPGTWRRWTGHSTIVVARCPKCSMTGSLADHEIAADGTVTPSIVCPFPGCDFHEIGCRLGWPGPA